MGPGATRRHLVWDWNGTLLDDLALVIAASNTAFASVGGPAITAEDHRRDFRRPIIDYYAAVLGRPVSAVEFTALDKLFHDTYQEGMPCALVADAVAALRAWPGSQSLLSMWFHSALVSAVTQYGLSGHFCRVDGRPAGPGEVETVAAPAGGPGADHKGPHLARHLAALELDGSGVVLIGDTVDDAHAAASAGAGCVLYTGGFSDPGQLRAVGVPVADSLLEAVSLAGSLT